VSDDDDDDDDDDEISLSKTIQNEVKSKPKTSFWLGSSPSIDSPKKLEQTKSKTTQSPIQTTQGKKVVEKPDELPKKLKVEGNNVNLKSSSALTKSIIKDEIKTKKRPLQDDDEIDGIFSTVDSKKQNITKKQKVKPQK
jgi:hypothetical protein